MRNRRLIAGLRSVSLAEFVLWTSTVMSLLGSAAMFSLWWGGETRFMVGFYIGLVVAAASIRELLGQRRAEVPVVFGMAAVVVLWFTLDDPLFRATFLIEVAFLPVGIVILRPDTWRVAMGGLTGLFVTMLAYEVFGRGAEFAEAFLQIGVIGVISLVVIHLIRRFDDQRRAAQARAVGIVSTSRIATVALNYREVVAQFDRLKSFGVSDVTHLLAEDRVLAYADMVEQVAANDAAETLHNEEKAPRFSERDGGRLAATRAELTAVWRGETWVQHEFSYVRNDGRPGWVLQDWAAPLVDGEPDYELVVLTTVDITTLKEAEVAKAREVEARDQFIASVSHELRTPLTGVVGLSLELRERGAAFDPMEAQELIELIADQSQDVANIVDDLLVEARLGQGNIQVSPESALVKDLLAIVPGSIEVAIQPDDLEVFADTHRFRQILRNLLTNAARYGGSKVCVRATQRGDRTLIEVADDGDPIPEGMRSSIFEPYQRAGDERGITAAVGLGLTVSRGLAGLMGGSLDYTYESGESIFRLALPSCALDVELDLTDVAQAHTDIS